jgi:hypothetical protein
MEEFLLLVWRSWRRERGRSWSLGQGEMKEPSLLALLRMKVSEISRP